MEISGINKVGPNRNIDGSNITKFPPKNVTKSDSLDVSDFLSIRKAVESAIPVNELKLMELQQTLAKEGKLEVSDDQLQIALNNFLNEIFS